MRVLGIDPGSRLTGYGCVDVVAGRLRAIEHGTLRLASTSGKQDVELEQRLLLLFQGLGEVLDRLQPDAFVVERVFFAKNAVSSLKLGQARGVVLVSGALRGISIHEYSASEVKRAVAGSGSADKDQVAKVLQLLLGGQDFKTSDASDALALAVCHAQLFLGSSGAYPRVSVRSSKKRLSLAESLGLTPERVGSARRVDFSKKE
ncbi:MAG: crossover junction endodeoxyribonuclease RuvC [Oligoflexia bacterium]